jgi:hypothetical protein
MQETQIVAVQGQQVSHLIEERYLGDILSFSTKFLPSWLAQLGLPDSVRTLHVLN